VESSGPIRGYKQIKTSIRIHSSLFLYTAVPAILRSRRYSPYPAHVCTVGAHPLHRARNTQYTFAMSFVSISVDIISRVVMINTQDFWFTPRRLPRRAAPRELARSPPTDITRMTKQYRNFKFRQTKHPSRGRLQCGPRRRRRPRALGLAPELARSDRFVPPDRIPRPDGHVGRVRRRYRRLEFENPSRAETTFF
jgi:hypothetical protein